MPESVRKVLFRADAISAMIGVLGVAVTFYPPDSGYVKIILFLVFVALTAAAVSANVRQEAIADNRQSIATDKQDAHTDSLAVISGLVADMRDRLHGEGTLKERASLLAAEMFRFVAVTFQSWPMEQFTIDLEQGGRVHGAAPNAEYGRNATREFAVQFEERLNRVLNDLKDRGIEDEILSRAVAAYDKDFSKTDWIARRLAELANGLPE